MPDSRPSSRGSRPGSRGKNTPRAGRPESAPEPPPPLPTHELTLSFDFDLTPAPLPPPPEPEEGAEPPPEGEEAEPPKPPLEDTFFELTLPPPPSSGNPRTFKLKHPHSGETLTKTLKSEVVVTVDDSLIRWLVVEAQGMLPLTLKRSPPEDADEEWNGDICEVAVDVGALIFGKQHVKLKYEGDSVDLLGRSYGGASSSVGMGRSVTPPPPSGNALPAGLSEVATALSVGLEADRPLLSPELLTGLNPMSVTLVRGDGFPAHYSGTPFKRPFAELAELCAPVYVTWELLGTQHRCQSKPHAGTILWNERRLLLAGSRVIDPKQLCKQLREVGLKLEIHDRDPLGTPDGLGEAVEITDGAGGEGGDEAAEDGDGGDGEETATPADAPAAADAEPESAQFPPFGTASSRLGMLIPRRPTDAAIAYAPGGIPIRADRRVTLELEVFPCERPKKKPEPEEAAAEYYPGAYLESGTELTVALELATPLVPEKKPRPAAELQRIVTLIRYNDTPTLLGLLSLVKAANDAIGMNSASAWESYKEDKREDLDLVTGIQIVDGETRLFIFEGQPATYEPLNAMGRLGKMLERTQPNSNLAFTLMNTSITFPTRLYNTFEMPTKLIKLRSTLPQLLVKPDIYQYLRVQEGCRDALLCLGKLLQSTTLRYAYKAEAFPAAKDLMQLEKKFGGVQLVVDREGVVEDDDDDEEEEGVAGAPSGAGGKAGRAGGKRHRHAPRKAATDCQNEAWYGSLKTREDAEPIDYMAKNIADLPKPPTPKPLPEWYLASIPRPKGPIFAYSGQRLNQTEVQKETLRNTLEKLHKQGKHMSYNRNFLWADSIGDREPPKPKREEIPNLDPDRHLTPWDARAPPVYNKDGTLSSYRMLQPSDYRTEELKVPWDEEALLASQRPIAREDKPPLIRAADGTMRSKPRFDPNPKASGFLEEFPESRFRSIFQQTEEGIAAEHAERIEGAIEIWKKKLVVDEPVLRVDLRIRDRPLQTDKYTSTLKDKPMKRSLKALYRGKNHMTRVPEPSAFMHEPTVDLSLQSRGEGMRATWSTMKWPEPAGGSTLKDSLASSGPRSARMRSVGR